MVRVLVCVVSATPRRKLFEQAALALTAVMTDPAQGAAREAVTLECGAPDHELLLTEWLNALIYERATRKMLLGRCSVMIDKLRLNATAWGEPIDLARHHPSVEIKGATRIRPRLLRACRHTRIGSLCV